MNAAIKIVGMSGGDEGRIAATKTDSYADAFLVKPFKAETLLTEVHWLLQLATAKF